MADLGLRGRKPGQGRAESKSHRGAVNEEKIQIFLIVSWYVYTARVSKGSNKNSNDCKNTRAREGERDR